MCRRSRDESIEAGSVAAARRSDNPRSGLILFSGLVEPNDYQVAGPRRCEYPPAKTDVSTGATACPLAEAVAEGWCAGRDLNPHGISTTSPSNSRVCLFHHPRNL